MSLLSFEKGRSWLGRIVFHGLLICLLLACVALLLFYIEWSSNRRLEDQREAFRAAGYPATIEEIEPPQVPDDQNAAVIYERAAEIAGGVALNEDQAAFFDDFVERLRNDSCEDDGNLAAEEVEMLLAVVERHEETYATIRKGVALDSYRYPTGEWNLSNLSNPTRMFQQLIPYVLLRAKAEALRSNDEAAYDWLADGLHMINDQQPAIMLIGAMIYSVDVRNFMTGVPHVLNDVDSPPAEGHRIHAELARTTDRESFAQSLLSERLFMELQMASQPRGILDRITNPFSLSVRRTWNEQMAAAAEVSRIEDHGERIRARNELMTGAEDVSITQTTTKIMVPAVSRSMEAFDAIQAHVRLIQVALELKRYASVHGEYPSSLDALNLGERVLNPVDNRAFGYSRTDVGFSLTANLASRSHPQDSTLEWCFR